MTKYLCFIPVLACATQNSGSSPCYKLCQELVQTCDYDAFPSFASCEEGCLYYEEEEVDIQSQLECITEAECDPFSVIECEHQHGVSSVE